MLANQIVLLKSLSNPRSKTDLKVYRIFSMKYTGDAIRTTDIQYLFDFLASHPLIIFISFRDRLTHFLIDDGDDTVRRNRKGTKEEEGVR